MKRSIFFVLLLIFSLSLIAQTNNDIYVQLDNNSNLVDRINQTLKLNPNKRIKISLKKDIYHINKLLLLNNIQSFELDGNESTFILEKESMGFMNITNSNNISVLNFSIDYSVLPNSTGKIVAIDRKNNTITFEPFENERINIEKNLLNQADKKVYCFSLSAPGIIKENGTAVTFITDAMPINGGKYLLRYKAHGALAEGDTLVIVFRYPVPVFFMNVSDKIYFNNVTVYSAPSGVFVGKEASNAQFRNCRVLIKDHRYISSNADVFHFQSSRKGPIINNCIVEGVGDDIAAFYTIPMYAVAQTNNSLLISEKNFIMKVGDKIDFFNDEHGEIFYSADVDTIDRNGKLWRVQFKQNIPKNIDFNMLRLYDKNCTSDGFVIQNSVFKKSRRHGCYLKASNGKVIGNIFSQLGGSAIAINNEPNWPEGLNSENILIQNNQMFDCGYGMNPKNAAMIDIKFLRLNGFSKQNVQKNIRIIDNNITNKTLFSIHNVSDFNLIQ